MLDGAVLRGDVPRRRRRDHRARASSPWPASGASRARPSRTAASLLRRRYWLYLRAQPSCRARAGRSSWPSARSLLVERFGYEVSALAQLLFRHLRGERRPPPRCSSRRDRDLRRARHHPRRERGARRRLPRYAFTGSALVAGALFVLDGCSSRSQGGGTIARGDLFPEDRRPRRHRPHTHRVAFTINHNFLLSPRWRCPSPSSLIMAHRPVDRVPHRRRDRARPPCRWAFLWCRATPTGPRDGAHPPREAGRAGGIRGAERIRKATTSSFPRALSHTGGPRDEKATRPHDQSLRPDAPGPGAAPRSIISPRPSGLSLEETQKAVAALVPAFAMACSAPRHAGGDGGAGRSG